MADISKITLPSGNSYNIKDAYARQLLAGGLQFNVCWDGSAAPVVANIPAGVTVTYNNTEYTGTKAASTAEPMTFYLVKEVNSMNNNVYSEYVSIRSGAGTEQSPYTYAWEKLGDTTLDLSNLGALAYKDNVSFSKGAGDVVLGESTTFKVPQMTVTFTEGTSDSVLGADTTFTSSTPTITVTPTTTNIKATASGAAVGANGTAAAITGFGSHTTASVLTSVTPDKTKKLVTTSIPNVTGNTSVSIPNVTGNTDVSIPNVTNAGSASTWSFTMGSGDNAETLVISGANSTAPTLGTALSASKVTLGTALSASKVTLGTAITAATGSVTTSGTGDAVVTDVSSGGTADAITALGTPTTSNCLTGVKVTSQPTIALATGATAGTGVISVATGISSASSTQPTITVGTNDQVTAVTGIGTGKTVSNQSVTVGTNDKVTVAKYADIFGTDGVVVITNGEA